MKTIELSAITILPNRQRRDFNPNKMQEFSDGIRKRGLLHPIILRQDGDKFILVAGGSAGKAGGMKQIPNSG